MVLTAVITEALLPQDGDAHNLALAPFFKAE
jgi:hypothetical protein